MISISDRPNRGNDGVVSQARRFAIVGLVATAVHFSVIVIVVDLFRVSNATLATFLGTCVGIVISYLGHHRYTFSAVGEHRQRFVTFVAAYGAVMTLHAGLMYLLTEKFGLSYAIPFVAATGISTLITFVLNRQVVFRRPN